MAVTQQNVPALRFPEFNEAWTTEKLGNCLERVIDPVEVEFETQYREIGVRSHGRGIFHKKPVSGKSLGNKRVFWVSPNSLILNIVFAWERAISLTSNNEKGFIASHRFPMYVSVNSKINLKFIFLFFLRKRGKFLLELASPGGAGRNKTLGQSEFAKLKVVVPSFSEQQKIATFLSSVDTKIEQLNKKKSLLEQYKKGLMQKLFSQEIRFKDERGEEYPNWEEKCLTDVFKEIKETVGDRGIETFSITAGKGFVSQTKKFGKDISGNQNRHYTVIPNGAFAYNKGNSKTYNYGCIYPNSFGRNIAVPRVFICFRLRDSEMAVGYFSKLFESHYLDRGLRRIISSSARMDGLLNVNKKTFFSLKIVFPNQEEQQKIADFLSSIDKKIEFVTEQIKLAQTFKKGLLQQMFI